MSSSFKEPHAAISKPLSLDTRDAVRAALEPLSLPPPPWAASVDVKAALQAVLTDREARRTAAESRKPPA